MQLVSIINRAILILVLIKMAGCGYLSSGSENGDTFNSDGLSVSCQLAPESFTNFLERRIENQIYCLESSLNKFLISVESDTPNTISQSTLEKFIRKILLKNSTDDKLIESATTALDIFFELNSYLFKDNPGFLSKKNINRITGFLAQLNKNIVSIGNARKKIDPGKDFGPLRDEIIRNVQELSDTSSRLIDRSKDSTTKLNLSKFIGKIYGMLNFSISEKKLRLLTTFIKKVFIGGDENLLTIKELFFLLENSREIAAVVTGFLDKNIDLTDLNNLKTAKLYLELASLSKRMIKQAGTNPKNIGNKPLFDNRELIEIATIVYNLGRNEKDSLNFLDYFDEFKKPVQTVKETFIGGDSDLYYREDLINLLDDAQKLSETFLFNNISYHQHKDLLDSPKKLNQFQITLNDHPDYNSISSENMDDIKENFLSIVTNLHSFRIRENIQYFLVDVKRTLYGINETSLLRWGLNKIFKANYGHVTPAGKYAATVEEMEYFLKKFKPLFKRMGILPATEQRFKDIIADIVLLMDLFQIQSNGNSKADLPEIIEYIPLLLTTYTISNKLHGYIERACRNDPPRSQTAGKRAIRLQCYKYNFFPSFIQTRYAFEKYMPGFFKFLKMKHHEKLTMGTFLRNLEHFSLDPSEYNLDRSHVDTYFIINSLLNVELMMAKFDLNQTNILEFFEIKKSYPLFKDIIMDVAKLDQDEESYAESIFYYLTKYRKIPSLVSLWIFHYGPDSKKQCTLQRHHIASILRYIKIKMNER